MCNSLFGASVLCALEQRALDPPGHGCATRYRLHYLACCTVISNLSLWHSGLDILSCYFPPPLKKTPCFGHTSNAPTPLQPQHVWLLKDIFSNDEQKTKVYDWRALRIPSAKGELALLVQMRHFAHLEPRFKFARLLCCNCGRVDKTFTNS